MKNTKGFTLVELLAVITIMGILMMVAIPAVSRTIENSRRDTFANVAQSYINAVRNAVLADELTCNGTNVSATSNGIYYFQIDTSTSSGAAVQQQTVDMMESGGLSSWGNANVKGYVLWTKQTVNKGSGATATTSTNTEYYIHLTDTGNHGTVAAAGDSGAANEIRDQKIKRTSIATSGATSLVTPAARNYASIKDGTKSSVTPTKCTLS